MHPITPEIFWGIVSAILCVIFGLLFEIRDRGRRIKAGLDRTCEIRSELNGKVEEAKADNLVLRAENTGLSDAYEQVNNRLNALKEEREQQPILEVFTRNSTEGRRGKAGSHRIFCTFRDGNEKIALMSPRGFDSETDAEAGAIVLAACRIEKRT